MKVKVSYSFSATLYKDYSKGAWSFVSVPKDISAEIRTQFGWQEEGWGRLKAQAQIGESTWETAIWFDSKAQLYLLPVKSEIRKKEKLIYDKLVSVTIWV